MFLEYFYLPTINHSYSNMIYVIVNFTLINQKYQINYQKVKKKYSLKTFCIEFPLVVGQVGSNIGCQKVFLILQISATEFQIPPQ